MNPNKSVYHLALLTLEAVSAHGIHSGQSEFVQDVVLLRDANGLPALPGTSLAGVLRHLYCDRFGQEAAGRLFGNIEKNQGHGSNVNINWALVHDSQNQVKEGLLENTRQDYILYELSQAHPIVRQRVRLDARGAATDTGKFDVSFMPAGTRYSTLIGYWSDGSQEDEQAWQDFLGLLYSPFFRIGHGTRNGAGAFKVQALHASCWDLSKPEDKTAYINRPRSRMAARKLPLVSLSPASGQGNLSLELNLKSEAGWRIGGGDALVGFASDEAPDLKPQTEWFITWQNNQAEISARKYLVPASALKGALAHRFAFHYRCLSQNWVGAEPESAHNEQAVKDLFGYAGDKNDEGQAGLVFFNDLYLEGVKTATQMHNRIDQFTGGVMTGALFEDGLLWKTDITLSLQLQNNSRLQALGPAHRQALQRTLEDLCEGRLPLGAGGSRGLGVFVASSELQWSDSGEWIKQGEQA